MVAEVVHIGLDKVNQTVQEALCNSERSGYTAVMIIGVRRKDDIDEIELITSSEVTYERGIFYLEYTQRRVMDCFIGIVSRVP